MTRGRAGSQLTSNGIEDQNRAANDGEDGSAKKKKKKKKKIKAAESDDRNDIGAVAVGIIGKTTYGEVPTVRPNEKRLGVFQPQHARLGRDKKGLCAS